MTQQSKVSSEAASPEGKLQRGLGPLVMRQGVIVLIGLVTQLFMTRVLTPEEFGYAVSAFVVIGVARLFINGGLAIYLIQRKTVRG